MSVRDKQPPINVPTPAPTDIGTDGRILIPGTGGGGSGDLNYIHTQAIPASTWTINHNLGKNPSIVVIDTGGSEWEGDKTYPTVNTMTISFDVAGIPATFAGVAYLN